MFEAIHGTALRMVKEGRAQYANPMSMIKAGSMILEHLGYLKEKKIVATGRPIILIFLIFNFFKKICFSRNRFAQGVSIPEIFHN